MTGVQTCALPISRTTEASDESDMVASVGEMCVGFVTAICLAMRSLLRVGLDPEALEVIRLNSALT